MEMNDQIGGSRCSYNYGRQNVIQTDLDLN